MTGFIMLGYSPPESTLKEEAGQKRLDLFVLWLSQFTVTDKGS
jgi:hypothetical protein